MRHDIDMTEDEMSITGMTETSDMTETTGAAMTTGTTMEGIMGMATANIATKQIRQAFGPAFLFGSHCPFKYCNGFLIPFLQQNFRVSSIFPD